MSTITTTHTTTHTTNHTGPGGASHGSVAVEPTEPTRIARRVARITGLAYLGIIATGIFAEFFVRGSLVVDDDPTSTAREIAAAPGLFRVGVAADVAMVAFDVVVAIGLFRLLRSVDRRLAVTATMLRLIQGAVIIVNLFVLTRALGFAQDAVALDGTILPGPARQALDAVEHHALGYDAGLIAFGLHCIVLGWLLTVSKAVPRWIGLGMFATGAVYLVGSFAALFVPGLSAAIDPFYLIALVVELGFATVLITRGLRPTRAAA